MAKIKIPGFGKEYNNTVVHLPVADQQAIDEAIVRDAEADRLLRLKKKKEEL